MNIITNDARIRLLKDVKDIIKNPLNDNNIYYIHDETNMLFGYSMIVGTEDTPYFGGFYLFKFLFPYNYPYTPPVVEYCTNNGFVRFNPNLYKNGKVCVSILNTWVGEKWTACQSIRTILLALCTLLNNQPFLNEPGKLITDIDCLPYNSCIEYYNIDYAMCDIMLNVPTHFLPFLIHMKEHFFKNYEYILAFVNLKIKNNATLSDAKSDIYIKVLTYDMNVIINYVKLKQKLINTKMSIENC